MNEPNALNDVAKFHKLFDAPVLPSAQIPHQDRCALRISLLEEELNELKDAVKEGDIVEVADALSDLQYVLSGAVLEFGLGNIFKELFDEVQRSNMSKACTSKEIAEKTVQFYYDKDGTQSHIVEKDGKFLVYRQSDNKVLKSIEYSPADLESIIEKSAAVNVD